METPNEIVELKGEIRKLNDTIGEIETERQSAMTDRELKISHGAKITAMSGLLTVLKQRLLFLEQQSKFYHIFPLSFPKIFSM